MRRGVIAVSWIAAFLVGLLLRLWNLPDQILGGDELHGVRAALQLPLAKILRTYGQVDPCIPLASFYRLVIDFRGYLDETVVRLPSLLSGLVALVAMPLLTRRRLGWDGAQRLAWMVAISPLWVLYSRLARPYMPVVLLGFVAFMAFDRWVEERQRRWAVLWAVSSGLAIWFHLVTAPLVLSPWLFEVVRKVVARRSRSSTGLLPWPALLGFGGLAGLVILALVGPAASSVVEVLQVKQGGSQIGASTLLGVWYLQAGTARGVLSVVFWALALTGLARLFASQTLFAARCLCAVIAQLATVWLLSPYGVSNPLVLNRYWLVISPIVFCWWASAFPLGRGADIATTGAAPGNRVGRGAGFAVAALVFLFLVRGPLLSRAYATSSFTQSNDYVAFHNPKRVATTILTAQPAGALEALSETGPLLVFPWSSRWLLNRGLARQQQVLGRSMVVASPERPLSLPSLRLRNLSAADPASFLASRARYLAIFLDLADEERRWGGPGRHSHFRPTQVELFRGLAQAMVGRLEAEWGPPLARDERVVVWDLAALRGRS